jgi:hypothetical protein
VLSKNETFIPGSLLEVTVWAWDSANTIIAGIAKRTLIKFYFHFIKSLIRVTKLSIKNTQMLKTLLKLHFITAVKATFLYFVKIILWNPWNTEYFLVFSSFPVSLLLILWGLKAY